MRYNKQINLKLYAYENSEFVLQAIIDDYQEISFAHNLYEAGDFTVTINYNIPNALKFERGMWIQFGNDSYMFGEIQSITDSIGEDGKGSQVRTITGKDARFIFKRRIIKNLNNEENWSMTAKGEICMRELVKAQCGSGAEEKRQLPITNTIPESAIAIGKEYSVAEAFSNLYDTLVTIATQSEIGWRIKFDGTLTLEVFEGSDLSSQVQFSTDFDSLSNGEFTDNAESYANTIYVGGKGTGSDRDIYEGESAIEGESPTGLDRYEAWDNQSSMTSESEYEAEAFSMLTQYGQTLQIAGQGLAKCPYEFQKQYNIGDTITLAFSGKSAKAQILSVTEHWIWGQYGIEFSFGKPQNDLSRQLQLILKQIQKASNKTTTTSSVRYYTIPTDTSQPKADVIYDTIGFQGDCRTGATFQLYYDSEKTGAKTYHVWLKQLSGGKLTLTTGVDGATNLVLNSGTYVAIIYVDANGNVLSQGATATDTIQSGSTQPATSSGVAGAISTEAENRNTAIETAINALDVASVGGENKFIQSISETDGKINATAGNLASSVQSGNANPVSSGAVADALKNVTDIASSLPTDSVLHYSFDEVPDYPDGTADVRLLDNNTYDIQATDYKFFDVNAHGTTFTNVNGKLQITIPTGNDYGAQIRNAYIVKKIIKLKINVTSINGTLRVKDGTGSGGITLGEITRNGIYEYTFIHDSSPEYNNFFFLTVGATSSATLTVEQIYIGNGSYSTPIIDNANGQYNATNNGGIATKGVSGKGVESVSANTYLSIPKGNLTNQRTLSFWLKVTQYIDNRRLYAFGDADYTYLNNNKIRFRTWLENETKTLDVILDINNNNINKWLHIVVLSDFGANSGTKKLYVNGILIAEATKNYDYRNISQGTEWILFNGGAKNISLPCVIDDFQIFDRALSETEVLALYQNKANTPKYFPTPTNKIKQDSWELATSGGVFSKLLNYANFLKFNVSANGGTKNLIDYIPMGNVIENYMMFATVLGLSASKVYMGLVQCNYFNRNYYFTTLVNTGSMQIATSSGQNGTITNNETYSMEIVLVKIR